MTYDYLEHWTQRALEKPKFLDSVYKRQEEELAKILQYTEREIAIIELGCGTGRITQVIFDNVKIKEYLGIDISQKRINESSDRFLHYPQKIGWLCEDITKFELPFYSDLVVAVEFFMHIKPEDIKRVFGLLKNVYSIINIDYSPKNEIPLLDHNFVHDYEKLYHDIGFKVVQKIRIGPQVLFYATH